MSERRNRSIRIGWVVMLMNLLAWRFAFAGDGMPPAIKVLDGKPADTAILGLYVFFVARDIKRSMRVVMDKINGKQDKSACDQRHYDRGGGK